MRTIVESFTHRFSILSGAPDTYKKLKEVLPCLHISVLSDYARDPICHSVLASVRCTGHELLNDI